MALSKEAQTKLLFANAEQTCPSCSHTFSVAFARGVSRLGLDHAHGRR